MIRTRFAPSPTGYLHIGGARTALFSWAFARHHGGQFILRIEDTDIARSTPEAVQAIIDGMAWLGLNHDEGPFYQTKHLYRYKEVIAQMLENGQAYHCYCSTDELDAMREAQRARGEKPRYDGRWRPEPGKTLPTAPSGNDPVVRFRNPTEGNVAWKDLVKGTIEFANSELDDLIIARGDGTPTYNFCVVVDDWDMQISHVIRGDDHVNNTPRQINILKALGAPVPQYAHLSMILGDDGTKLSKRHGAVSVMQYFEEGYLPEAVINYLARLGWSHGDAEIFDREQFVQWFDLDHITPSAAQFNTEKLRWLNQQYIKAADDARLADLMRPFLVRNGANPDDGPDLAAVCALVKERAATIAELADAATLFYRTLHPSTELLAQHVTPEVLPALADLATRLENIAWERSAISAALKETLAAHGLKMPKLAMPVRVLVTGEPQTPAIDATLELIGQQKVVSRLKAAL
ncbi:MAG: glutamate--tRNA ligase [Sulfuriferula multivorans]|uniref:Glutamate--tRNA ligase n=1 Tax=Sulfuriferula multivorans TaxID=1559896 RepID=A0A7C9NQQ1_9PROT|nr:glutamate--tRNA ligase [Sulfuriferula multivorans]